MTTTATHLARRRVSQLEIALMERRFTFSNEAELQRGIEIVLASHPLFLGIANFREVEIKGAGRIDFLVRGIGVECKVAGSVASIAPQILSYLESSVVDALLLVTTKRAHTALEGTHLGKLVRVHVLTGGLG